MKYIVFFLTTFLLLNGCASVNTFPTVARAGDTVSIMVGGTENARKETIAVILTDINGLDWDLRALGLVRSVFNLRSDGRAQGLHYSAYLDTYVSWMNGHEPVQTVLITDLPIDVPAGAATVKINTLITDDSSGISSPFTVNLDIIAGTGSTDKFKRKNSDGSKSPADFSRLEPAPHAKINFGISDGVVIGAVSLVVDFDETIVGAGDINVYVPESSVRGSLLYSGSFGKTQRMVYWHQDGQQLFIDVVAPQGINQAYLKMYLVHPSGLSAEPNFSLTSSRVYDINGDEIALIPVLEYFP